MMRNFHVDDLQVNFRYNMILGCDIYLELKIDLCFSDNTVRGNVGAYKECTLLDIRIDPNAINGKTFYQFQNLSYIE